MKTETAANGTSPFGLSREATDHLIDVEPEEDARLEPLKARIEWEWHQIRPSYFRLLQREGRLQESIHRTAIWCIETLNQFQEKSLNPDQGRETIQELILPQGSLEVGS